MASDAVPDQVFLFLEGLYDKPGHSAKLTDLPANAQNSDAINLSLGHGWIEKIPVAVLQYWDDDEPYVAPIPIFALTPSGVALVAERRLRRQSAHESRPKQSPATGNNGREATMGGIPSVAEIERLLEAIYLIELHDIPELVDSCRRFPADYVSIGAWLRQLRGRGLTVDRIWDDTIREVEARLPLYSTVTVDNEPFRSALRASRDRWRRIVGTIDARHLMESVPPKAWTEFDSEDVRRARAKEEVAMFRRAKGYAERLLRVERTDPRTIVTWHEEEVKPLRRAALRASISGLPAQFPDFLRSLADRSSPVSISEIPIRDYLYARMAAERGLAKIDGESVEITEAGRALVDSEDSAPMQVPDALVTLGSPSAPEQAPLVDPRYLEPWQTKRIEAAIQKLDDWPDEWFPRAKLAKELRVPANNVDDHFRRNHVGTSKEREWKRGGGNRMDPAYYHRVYLRLYLRTCWKPTKGDTGVSVCTDRDTEGTDGITSEA